MELVHTVLAGKGRHRSVNAMENTVADTAFFNTVHFLVDVGLPKEDGRDDITISRLDQVADGEGPLAHLACLKLELVGEVNDNRLEGVLGRNLQLDLDRDLRVLVVGRDDFLRRLVQHECKLVLGAKLDLGQFDLFNLVLHDSGADDLLDVRPGHSQDLLIAGVIELAGEGREALHEVDQGMQTHHSAFLLGGQRAVLGLVVSQVSRVVVLERLLDNG